MDKYEKTNTPNLVVDQTTGAVLNTDIGAYQAIKKAREEKRKQAEYLTKLDHVSNSLDDLTRRLETLEHLLRCELGDDRD